MRIAKLLALIIAMGVLVIGYRVSRTDSPPAEVKLENLFKQSLHDEFIAGREVVVSYVELPPHTTLDRHWHPGEEFIYFLEGEAEIVIDGQDSIHGKPHTVGHVPYKKMHTAVTRDKGAKAIVFRLHTKGEPIRYLEGGDEAKK